MPADTISCLSLRANCKFEPLRPHVYLTRKLECGPSTLKSSRHTTTDHNPAWPYRRLNFNASVFSGDQSGSMLAWQLVASYTRFFRRFVVGYLKAQIPYHLAAGVLYDRAEGNIQLSRENYSTIVVHTPDSKASEGLTRLDKCFGWLNFSPAWR